MQVLKWWNVINLGLLSYFVSQFCFGPKILILFDLHFVVSIRSFTPPKHPCSLKKKPKNTLNASVLQNLAALGSKFRNIGSIIFCFCGVVYQVMSFLHSYHLLLFIDQLDFFPQSTFEWMRLMCFGRRLTCLSVFLCSLWDVVLNRCRIFNCCSIRLNTFVLQINQIIHIFCRTIIEQYECI